MAVSPTAVRNSSRPTPGFPPGNVEKNSYCRPYLLDLRRSSSSAPVCRVTVATEKRIPRNRHLFIPLLWSGRGSGGLRRSQLDDAATYGNGYRLRAITGPQLLHDVFDMNLDGLFRDEELFGNVAISIPAGDVP